jgi:hypothetical protein
MKERAFSYFSAPYTAEALIDMLRHATDAPVWDEGIEAAICHSGMAGTGGPMRFAHGGSAGAVHS